MLGQSNLAFVFFDMSLSFAGTLSNLYTELETASSELGGGRVSFVFPLERTEGMNLHQEYNWSQ